jgi:hypothetical protein
MLYAVYGDTFTHQNPGQHISEGVNDDQKWQDYWQGLIVYPFLIYDAPSGAVGHCFVKKVAKLIDGIQTHKLNAEKFIVFHIVREARKKHQEKDLKAHGCMGRWKVH